LAIVSIPARKNNLARVDGRALKELEGYRVIAHNYWFSYVRPGVLK